jgi:hypothetical protein
MTITTHRYTKRGGEARNLKWMLGIGMSQKSVPAATIAILSAVHH